MDLGASEYIAIGFPLLVGFLLVILYPIRVWEYFSNEKAQELEQDLILYQFSFKDALYIFIVYTISVLALGLIQAFLLWDFAVDPNAVFVTRFTDFIFYPFLVSGVMAVFLMWFVFSCVVYSKGELSVKEFLRRNYDGWNMLKQTKRFKMFVIASAIMCTVANVWVYNIYLKVADDAIIVSDHKMLGSYKFYYDRIEYFRIEWHRDSDHELKRESFVLGVKLKGGGVARTDENMLYNNHMLEQIDQIIQASDQVSGRNYEVVFTEFPRSQSKEVRGLFNKK